MIELTVNDLHLQYGNNPVLKGVSMQLHKGEVVVLHKLWRSRLFLFNQSVRVRPMPLRMIVVVLLRTRPVVLTSSRFWKVLSSRFHSRVTVHRRSCFRIVRSFGIRSTR